MSFPIPGIVRFQCCSCPTPIGYDAAVDPPLLSFINACACPTVNVFGYTAMRKEPTLCGFPDFFSADDEDAEIPRSAYRKAAYSGSYTCPGPPAGSTISGCVRSFNRSFSGTIIYADSCVPEDERVQSTRTDTINNFANHSWGGHCEDETIITPTTQFWTSHGAGGPIISQASRYISPSAAGDGSPGQGTTCTIGTSNTTYQVTGGRIVTLSEPDTKVAALARSEFVSSGSDSQSIYELRTTSLSWTIKTVKFNLRFRNLCFGRKYKGALNIQRQTAYAGTSPEDATFDWEDVGPMTFGPFTALEDETEDGWTIPEELQGLDLPGGTEEAEGYRYRIWQSFVWPDDTDCDYSFTTDSEPE